MYVNVLHNISRSTRRTLLCANELLKVVRRRGALYASWTILLYGVYIVKFLLYVY